MHSSYVLYNFGNEIHLVLFALVSEGDLFLQGVSESLQIQSRPLHQLIDLLANILKIIVLDKRAFIFLVELLQVLLVDREIDFGMKVVPNFGHVLLAVRPLIKSRLVNRDLSGNHMHVVIELCNQGFEHALLAFSIKLVWVVDYFKYVFIRAVYST